ncbi:hypothetical protein SDC9_167445 [bioreactor metagenome]|uniref:Uncharacterized protein n=1 Tax=bioreactor metagenome TaxID=1076179 RepID=A0A645G2M9_9ZZZZ
MIALSVILCTRIASRTEANKKEPFQKRTLKWLFLFFVKSNFVQYYFDFVSYNGEKTERDFLHDIFLSKHGNVYRR